MWGGVAFPGSTLALREGGGYPAGGGWGSAGGRLWGGQLHRDATYLWRECQGRREEGLGGASGTVLSGWRVSEREESRLPASQVSASRRKGWSGVHFS